MVGEGAGRGAVTRGTDVDLSDGIRMLRLKVLVFLFFPGPQLL